VPFDLLMAGVSVLGAVLAGRLRRATLEH
jgi:hypothetical protein